MAELDVQPKKKKPFLPWLLLALGVVALIAFLLVRNTNTETGTYTTSSAATTNTATSTTEHTAAGSTTDWNSIDFNAPATTYDEISDKDILIRGNDNYTIYSMEESVLFDEGQSMLRTAAAKNLQQIANSINKRFSNGAIRIYGYTDASGNTSANQQLAQQRTAAVKSWLIQNGNITADRISLHPIGEAQPTGNNATADVRQQNRRVDIIARKSRPLF